jgi:RHS repeat-associated protein
VCLAIPVNRLAVSRRPQKEVPNQATIYIRAEQILPYPHPAVKLLNGLTPAAATYLHRDGLGSVRAITNAAGAKIEAALYKPFGEQSEWLLPGNAAPETKGWIGERFDADAGLQYLNARYYDPELSLFLQPDWFEVTKAGVGNNRFSYSFNDPVNKADPTGNEATKDKAGTLKDWLKDLFGSPSKMGDMKGNEASKKLISESATTVFGLPKSGYFTGTAKTRYVYTAKKGWIDMGHFVFWAGYAHNHKQSAPPRMSDEDAAKAAVAAVKSASYQQEGVGSLLGTRSGYSYEDLPSNLLGAKFGAEVFDPKSSMSLGDQISKYMERFDPRDPSESPNWKDVPSTEQVAAERYRQADVDPVPRNYSFDPMFILE